MINWRALILNLGYILGVVDSFNLYFVVVRNQTKTCLGSAIYFTFMLFWVRVSQGKVLLYVIDSEFSLKQSCPQTQFSGIKSEEQKFLLANVSGVGG